MNEEFEDLESADGKAIAKRYEEMLEKEENWFFDLNQIEDLVDHYFLKGLEELAMQAIEYGMSIFPDAPILSLRKAQGLATTGKMDESLSLLLFLLELEPFNDEIHLTLASLYSEKGDHPHAVHHLKVALKYCDPMAFNDIALDLAHEYENNHRYVEAISILKKAISKNPQNDIALYELAYLYDTIGDNARAIRLFHEFLDENPYSCAGWYNLGQSYILNGQSDKAIQALEYAVVINEHFLDAQISLGHAHFAEENYQEAIQCYLGGMNESLPQPAVYCCIGECKIQLNQYREALRYFDKAIKESEDYTEAWVGRAIVFDHLGNEEESLISVNRAFSIDPTSVEIAMICGSMQMKAGFLEKAIEVFSGLVESLPNSIEGWVSLSDCHAGLGNSTDALRAIEQGLAENPDHTALLYRKVAFLHLTDKRKEALLLLRNLAEQEPEGILDLITFYPDFMQEEEVLRIVQSAGN